jgi:histidinol-phosphate aminotransferase
MSILQNRQFLKEELRNLGLKVKDSEANFLLVDFEEKCDYIFNQLKKTGIYVRKFNEKSRLSSFLRISIGTKKMCELFVRRIQRFIAELRGWQEIQQNPQIKRSFQGYSDKFWRH